MQAKLNNYGIKFTHQLTRRHIGFNSKIMLH